MFEPKRFVVVCGLPGTGKTTVATELAERLEATLVRTDVVRKDLYRDPDYTATETRRTYEETLTRAVDDLERNGAVVVDGTFRRPDQRARARVAAEAVGANFDLVYVTCDEDVVQTRIAERTDDESDADFDVHKLLRSEFEAPPESHRVDNSGSLEETRRQLASVFETLEANVP